ncbi:MAG: hypothetical protein HC809_15535 [Gammaproteobacteria bacterium]|nr:hypothetical protein [Gammaproteobacteria bacterium]
MKQVGSFVFDSVDLPEAVGRKLGIDPEMSARASDHLPVVIDLAWSDDKR